MVSKDEAYQKGFSWCNGISFDEFFDKFSPEEFKQKVFEKCAKEAMKEGFFIFMYGLTYYQIEQDSL
jgi:hypothetical protein